MYDLASREEAKRTVMKRLSTLASLVYVAGAITAVISLSGYQVLAHEPASPVPSVSAALTGKAVYEVLCVSCHERDMVENQRHTKAEWDELAHRMLDRGLVASEDQLGLVVDYLTQTFPPDPTPN